MPTDKRSQTRPERSHASRCSVLIAVEPPSLERVICHVLRAESGFRVVGGSPKGVSPANQAARLSPSVIVVNHRLRKHQQQLLIDLKRSSPGSTLILLTHSLDESAPPREADACLPEDAVVKRLLPMIRKTALRAADRTPLPAVAGLRS